MSFYGTWIFPRVLDLVTRQKQMTPFRRRIGKAATGRVLDLRICSGLNLPFYGPEASQVLGVDPSEEMLHLAEERGRTPPFAAVDQHDLPSPAVDHRGLRNGEAAADGRCDLDGRGHVGAQLAVGIGDLDTQPRRSAFLADRWRGRVVITARTPEHLIMTGKAPNLGA